MLRGDRPADSGGVARHQDVAGLSLSQAPLDLDRLHEIIEIILVLPAWQIDNKSPFSVDISRRSRTDCGSKVHT